MSFLSYLQRVFYGLPTYDSAELIAAKTRKFSVIDTQQSAYDIYEKQIDPFMCGAISPVNDADDLMTSSELEKRAKDIYEKYAK